jgi:hypothetical protein
MSVQEGTQTFGHEGGEDRRWAGMSTLTYLAAGVARVAATAAAVDVTPSGFFLLPILLGSGDMRS